MFDHLQASIFPLGYRLGESGRGGVGQTLSESVRRFPRKIQSTTLDKTGNEEKESLGLRCRFNQRKINRTNIEVQTAKPAPGFVLFI